MRTTRQRYPTSMTRSRERGMRSFSSPEQAQRFLSAHASVYGLVNLQRQLVAAAFYRRRRAAIAHHAVSSTFPPRPSRAACARASAMRSSEYVASTGT